MNKYHINIYFYWILILILIGLIVFWFGPNNFAENFTHSPTNGGAPTNGGSLTNEHINKISEIIINNIDKTTTYKEYLTLLIKAGNMSYSLLEQENFYKIKFLKENHMLSKDKIKNLIKN